MGLEFSDKTIDIPEEMKITLWRFNNGDKSPYGEGNTGCDVVWNLSAKSVKDDKEGIFGVQEEQIYFYNNFYLNLSIYAMPDATFLKLEADKRNIIAVDNREVAVTECNIIEMVNKDDFIKMFPGYLINTAQTVQAKGYLDIAFAMDNINKIAKQITLSNLFAGRKHGYAHSLRVNYNIQLLGKKMNVQDSELYQMRLFAYWHDIVRYNDGYDPEHGKRAADIINKNRNHYNLRDFSAEQIDNLCFACEHHTTMHRSGNTLIDICFDADRLDLQRVGIIPEPYKMATEIGAYYAGNYDNYLSELNSLISAVNHII